MLVASILWWLTIILLSCCLHHHGCSLVQAFSCTHYDSSLRNTRCLDTSSSYSIKQEPQKTVIKFRSRQNIIKLQSKNQEEQQQQQETNTNDSIESVNKNDIEEEDYSKFDLNQTSFIFDINNSRTLETISLSRRGGNRFSWLNPWRLIRRSHHHQSSDTTTSLTKLKFDYDYYQLELNSQESASSTTKTTTSPTRTTGIILVHPIGVGISKWYYQRLLHGLNITFTNNDDDIDNNNSKKGSRGCRRSYAVYAPDLLGCGTACNPKVITTTSDDKNDEVDYQSQPEEVRILPLFNITDWSDQILDLMTTIEKSQPSIDRWCIVANGGCSPIALKVAQRSVEQHQQRLASLSSSFPKKPVTNVILSCTPRLPFFLNSTDPTKVIKSYRTLCGIPGRLFWWYSCRNGGKFIQTFSEKNLVADPSSLGPNWTSNCVSVAKMNNGKNKFATFGFLAGNLQDGCVESFNTLKHHDENGKKDDDGSVQQQKVVQIGIIRGNDKSINRAKSWFWQKKRPPKRPKKQLETKYDTLRDYVERNGNGGRELIIGGKISLAHEDGLGYANAILQFLATNE